MRQGFFHAFLTAFRSKMTPNPMEFPLFFSQMPWKFHDLDLSKIHAMFQHGQQIKLGVVMEFGVDFGQTAMDL